MADLHSPGEPHGSQNPTTSGDIVIRSGPAAQGAQMKEDPLSMLQSPERKAPIASDALEKLRQAASTYPGTPSIIRHAPKVKNSELDKKLECSVPDWSQVRRKGMGVRRDLRDALSNMRTADSINRQAVQKVGKVAKTKGHMPGRTYTSRYRGVHQTFPTKRWEAQFRRNGKPTSLGCFDEEGEAARAYDKMMIWCELHHSTTLKAGITNFDMTEYEKDIPLLNTMTQDELTQSLRSDGRRQAAQRLLKAKREGQILHYQNQQQQQHQQQQQQQQEQQQQQQQQLHHQHQQMPLSPALQQPEYTTP